MQSGTLPSCHRRRPFWFAFGCPRVVVVPGGGGTSLLSGVQIARKSHRPAIDLQQRWLAGNKSICWELETRKRHPLTTTDGWRWQPAQLFSSPDKLVHHMNTINISGYHQPASQHSSSYSSTLSLHPSSPVHWAFMYYSLGAWLHPSTHGHWALCVCITTNYCHIYTPFVGINIDDTMTARMHIIDGKSVSVKGKYGSLVGWTDRMSWLLLQYLHKCIYSSADGLVVGMTGVISLLVDLFN